MLRLVMTCVVSIPFLTTPLFGMDVIDAFASSDHSQREAERGDWQFHDGMASVVADPELYKKYANHGPILKWTVDCSQGITSFDMHPSECQRVVFTLNGDGHVFRISLIDPEKGMTPFQKKGKSRMIAWAEKSSKENKGTLFSQRASQCSAPSITRGQLFAFHFKGRLRRSPLVIFKQNSRTLQ